MKKSDIEIFESPNLEGAIPDRYYIFDFVRSLESFASTYYCNDLHTISKIDNSFYIKINGQVAARFFRHSMKINRKSEKLNIYIRQTDDMLNLVIGTKSGLRIDEENRAELIRLAKLAGFYVNVNPDNGIIIIKCNVEIGDSVVLRAMDIPLYFLEKLEEVFFGDNA